MKNVNELRNVLSNILSNELIIRKIKHDVNLSNKDKLILINDMNVSKKVVEFIIYNLSLIQGKAINIVKGNERVDSSMYKHIKRIGKNPIFTYNIDGELIRIELSKKHSVNIFSQELLNVIDDMSNTKRLIREAE